METVLRAIGYLVIGIGLIGLVSLLVLASAWLLMWAWNVALVPIFNLPSITLLQAFAFNILLMSIKGIVSVTVNHKKE